MFSIGFLEWAIIIFLAFLFFGPENLPRIARSIGSIVGRFKNVQEEVTKNVKEGMYDPFKEDIDAIKSPFEEMKKPFDGLTKALHEPIATRSSKASRTSGEEEQTSSNSSAGDSDVSR